MPRQETVSAFVPVLSQALSAACAKLPVGAGVCFLAARSSGIFNRSAFLLAIEALLLETLFWNLAEDTLSEETELLSFCLAGNLFCCILKFLYLMYS